MDFRRASTSEESWQLELTVKALDSRKNIAKSDQK